MIDKAPDMHSGDELQEILKKMEQAIGGFYFMATKIGCHPFVEFTGLMNEYLKACTRAVEEGRDFVTSTDGHALELRAYELMYLREKLECIFGTGIAERLQEAPRHDQSSASR